MKPDVEKTFTLLCALVGAFVRENEGRSYVTRTQLDAFAVAVQTLLLTGS